MASNDHELSAIAADPRTDWDTLHSIAENHPALRPTVAENPATYPELLEALASLGDPEIDAALTRRRDALAAAAAQPEPTDPATPPALAGTPAQSAPSAQTPADPSPPPPPPAPAPGQDGTGNSPIAAPARSGAVRSAAPPRRRRSRAPKFLLTVLLPVLVLIALSALALSLLDGGSPEDSTAAESPAQAQSSQEPEDEPAEEPEPSPTEEPPTPDERRAELAALPQESSCDSPAADREVFLDLASAASENGSWVESEDATLVRDALLGLQDSCDNTHAAALFLDLRESEQTPNALRGTVADMGSAWIQASFPAQGQPLSSFVSPDGNVVCELADTLRCRVLQHSFSAPEGCTEGVTYAIRVDRTAEPDCENPVPQQGQQVLGYGQTASNEFFACTSFQSQMSCWNQLTGEGINLSASRNFTY
ncbi:hypothetical protein I2485_07215 [Nesterenkonia sp. E16_7]|uniref:variant leucine-rich repeat-containing protein n=1 Tax=unclassified Nesterenkonia TaxID=2629769 RepID=UPI001A916C2B|nr:MULTISPECIES: hypothetical protein [unclassified Nesterenkonia]MBO0594350.1 hypothetical protein [Nesterenkonia sp. E16_10]MBO0598440.1 hypothetical protein [Nesterenkonia sp. E16_7]